MKTGSKRGAALAYVIVITAALLILAAALISIAKFNLDASQNSLEGRQAYLDAKSAIEYGRAYLSLNPEKADTSFTILRDGSALGFKIGASGAANYVAKYDKDEKAINAAAKYKSSDRVRRLGYQFGTADGGNTKGNILSSYLVTGIGYGYGSDQMLKLFNDDGSFTQQNLKSDFSLVATKAVKILPGYSFTAPEMIFIGQQSDKNPSYCIYKPRGDASCTLTSDFFGFDGNIIAGAYTQEGQLRSPPIMRLVSKSGADDVIVHFASKVYIEFVDDSFKLITGIAGATAVEFEPGYYKFPSNTNLFDLANIKSLAQKLTGQDLKQVKSQFLTAEFTNNDITKLISSEQIHWTSEGKMENASPQAVTTENATVFMCAAQFNYQGGNSVVFQAPNIVFQWNTGNNLAVLRDGRSASVTFKAKNISINLKNTYGSPKLVASSPLSHFYLSSLTGATPNITFMTDTVIQAPTFTKTIEAGVYHIDHEDKVKNTYIADLFDDDLELDRVGDVDEGGSGGSGDVGLTSGVYTDGQ